MDACNDERKRVHNDSDDSESDSPESKIRRVESDSEANSSESQLTRVDSGGSFSNSDDSASARGIQDDLLNLLDDQDNVPERDSAMQGLDSVIKSFEQEILAPVPDESAPITALGPDSGELQPNLGYLFEASDDELGLPPAVMPNQEGKQENEQSGRFGPQGVDLTGFLGFEDDFPNYEAFGFDTGLPVECDAVDNAGAGGFVTVDGLFDYVEPTDILRRSESLQAT